MSLTSTAERLPMPTKDNPRAGHVLAAPARVGAIRDQMPNTDRFMSRHFPTLVRHVNWLFVRRAGREIAEVNIHLK